MDADALAERERQLAERPGLSGDLHVRFRDRLPAIVFPDVDGQDGRQPPPTHVHRRHVAGVESAVRLAQDRNGRRVAVGEQRREPVEQQVEADEVGADARRPSRPAPHRARSRPAPPAVPRTSPPSARRGTSRARASVRAARAGGRPPAARRAHRCRGLVANAIRARSRSARARSSSSSGPTSALTRATERRRPRLPGASPVPRPARLRRRARGGRQRRPNVEEGGGGGEPAACLGPRRGTFEVRGDVFVRHGRCLRAVPGAPIRVGLGIGRFGEGLMDLGPLDGAGGAVHRGANERMPEGHARRKRRSGPPTRRRRPPTPGSRAAGPPARRALRRRWVAAAMSSRSRASRGSAPRAAGSSPRSRRAAARRGQAEAARELGRRQAARQLQQGQRIAARLGMMRSSTWSSSGAGRTDSNRARASGGQAARRGPRAARRARRPSPARRTRSRSARPASRRARTRAPEPTRRSSHWASSITQRRPRSSAASDSSPRTASPTRNGSAAGPALSPNATSSASRCGRAGARASRGSGEQSC